MKESKVLGPLQLNVDIKRENEDVGDVDFMFVFDISEEMSRRTG